MYRRTEKDSPCCADAHADPDFCCLYYHNDPFSHLQISSAVFTQHVSVKIFGAYVRARSVCAWV